MGGLTARRLREGGPLTWVMWQTTQATSPFWMIRAEIIAPVLDIAGDRVIGTIDVESERLNAFDSEECACLQASGPAVIDRAAQRACI
jgi:hypothetical protein